MEANPQCGLRARRSRGTYLAASLIRVLSSAGGSMAGRFVGHEAEDDGGAVGDRTERREVAGALVVVFR
jgi:hypothetical protein